MGLVGNLPSRIDFVPGTSAEGVYRSNSPLRPPPHPLFVEPVSLGDVGWGARTSEEPSSDRGVDSTDRAHFHGRSFGRGTVEVG